MLTVIVDKKNIKNNEIVIEDKSDCNHIQNVYRLGLGDNLRVVDGEFEYITKISFMNKKNIFLEILEKIEDKYSLDREIDVAIGILKNDKMNLAIQKLTELGINKIIPIYTERVVVKLNEKKEKWDVVVKEALKQCKGVKFTEVNKIIKLRDIDFAHYDKIIYAYENSDSSKKINDIILKNDKKILYIIGPEGGITENEIKYLDKQGAYQISLGNRILRAETAAIIVGGILVNL